MSDTAAEPKAAGAHVVLSGTLLDGDGTPVPDAILEVWQADADGRSPASVPLPANLRPEQVAEQRGFGTVDRRVEDCRLLIGAEDANAVLREELPEDSLVRRPP